MNRPHGSPCHDLTRKKYKRSSIKSREKYAQWKIGRDLGRTTNVLRSYPHLLSAQPCPPTPWSPYSSHQYPSSVPWTMGREHCASPWAGIQDPIFPAPQQTTEAAEPGMQLFIIIIFKCYLYRCNFYFKYLFQQYYIVVLYILRFNWIILMSLNFILLFYYVIYYIYLFLKLISV